MLASQLVTAVTKSRVYYTIWMLYSVSEDSGRFAGSGLLIRRINKKTSRRGGILDWTAAGCFQTVVTEQNSCAVFTVSRVC
jgi:hypothetical protein